MQDRDVIFRERLISVMNELKAGASKERPLQVLIGSYAKRLFTESGARGWVDLKERADGGTYDSMLTLFTTQSEAAAKKNDPVAVRAFEVLALSLIARRQYQADLQPGVVFLDKYIEDCVAFVKRTRTTLVTPQRTAH